MNLKCRKTRSQLLVLVILCAICILTACAENKTSRSDDIYFTNNMGLELNIGVEKTVVEKAFNCSFKNNEYYPLGEQHCAFVFINDKLAYAEFNNPWKISTGPQFGEPMTDLFADFGEPEFESSAKGRTVIYELYYTIGNTKVMYSGDTDSFQNISVAVCIDDSINITDIFQVRQTWFEEHNNQLPVKACYGYDERLNYPEEIAKDMRKSLGTPYIELSIGKEKSTYEDLFKQRFEDGQYYRISNLNCVLYFKDRKLAVFGVGSVLSYGNSKASWRWDNGQKPEIELGQEITDTVEVYGNPVVRETSEDGKGISLLVFELRNGQRLGYKAIKNGTQIQYIYVMDANTDIIRLPEE